MNLSGLAAVVLIGPFPVLQDSTGQGPAATLARAEAQWHELFFRVSGFQKLDAPIQGPLFSAPPGRR
jgi:hypothetical protein